MAFTKYSFIKENTPDLLNCELNKAQNEGKFNSVYDHINTTGTIIDIWFIDSLDSLSQTNLQFIIDNHSSSFLGDKNYLVKEYQNNKKRLLKSTWYNTDNNDGTYSDIVEETVYKYKGKKIESYTVTKYWANGIKISSETYVYYTNTNPTREILKRVQ